MIGTLYVYRQNGGAHGQYFLQRFLAIGWVVSLRWAAGVLLALVCLFVEVAVIDALASTGWRDTDWPNEGWLRLSFLAVAEIVFVWRFGHHVKDLATRTKAMNG